MKKATIYLSSICIVCMLAAGCKKNIANKDVITIVADSASAAADGTTRIRIHGYVADRAEDTKRTINFSCNTGTFDTTIATKNISRTAMVSTKLGTEWKWEAAVSYVASDSAGTAFIVAEAQGYTDTAWLVLGRTYPDSLALDIPFAVAVGYGGEITVTGTMLAGWGLPSIGTIVHFTDTYTASGLPVGGSRRSEHYQSDARGTVSFVYSPGQVTAGQFITITGFVLADNGIDTLCKQSRQVYLK